jgi:hypothetical protein
MATSNYDQVWEAVRSLSPEELERVRSLIEALLANPALRAGRDQLSANDQVDLASLKEGALSRIPPPITDLTPYQNRKPIQVKGKPVSETIIEERR